MKLICIDIIYPNLIELALNDIIILYSFSCGASQVLTVVKNPPANTGDVETQVQSLVQEVPLEEGMTSHSSILA